jgi:hypothetical protein
MIGPGNAPHDGHSSLPLLRVREPGRQPLLFLVWPADRRLLAGANDGGAAGAGASRRAPHFF